MADPNQIHPEGPTKTPPVDVTISVNTASRDHAEATDVDENRLQQYDLLRQQVSDGKYDGDGPADVAPTCQEEEC